MLPLREHLCDVSGSLNDYSGPRTHHGEAVYITPRPKNKNMHVLLWCLLWRSAPAPPQPPIWTAYCHFSAFRDRTIRVSRPLWPKGLQAKRKCVRVRVVGHVPVALLRPIAMPSPAVHSMHGLGHSSIPNMLHPIKIKGCGAAGLNELSHRRQDERPQSPPCALCSYRTIRVVAQQDGRC